MRKRTCGCKGLSGVAVTRRSLIEQVEACGSHYFDKDTMRFFNSKLLDPIYPDGGAGVTYFVTSERGPGMARRYSVRVFKDCGVKTVGEFQQYRTADAAKTAARRLAKGK